MQGQHVDPLLDLGAIPSDTGVRRRHRTQVSILVVRAEKQSRFRMAAHNLEVGSQVTAPRLQRSPLRLSDGRVAPADCSGGGIRQTPAHATRPNATDCKGDLPGKFGSVEAARRARGPSGRIHVHRTWRATLEFCATVTGGRRYPGRPRLYPATTGAFRVPTTAHLRRFPICSAASRSTARAQGAEPRAHGRAALRDRRRAGARRPEK